MGDNNGNPFRIATPISKFRALKGRGASVPPTPSEY